jgi:predicted metal-binding protein
MIGRPPPLLAVVPAICIGMYNVNLLMSKRLEKHRYKSRKTYSQDELVSLSTDRSGILTNLSDISLAKIERVQMGMLQRKLLAKSENITFSAAFRAASAAFCSACALREAPLASAPCAHS